MACMVAVKNGVIIFDVKYENISFDPKNASHMTLSTCLQGKLPQAYDIKL